MAATRSGNPATRAKAKAAAAPSAPTSVSEFKKKNKPELMELPSGVYMTLRNPGGLRLFLKQGLIPNSLMLIVQESLDKGQDQLAKKVDQQGVDPAMAADMIALVDVVTIAACVEPQVHEAPETEADRDDEILYVDELEDEDKMFIFQWVSGGTRDLESFRAGLSKQLAAVAGS